MLIAVMLPKFSEEQLNQVAYTFQCWDTLKIDYVNKRVEFALNDECKEWEVKRYVDVVHQCGDTPMSTLRLVATTSLTHVQLN